MSIKNDFQSNRPYTLFYYPSSRLPPLTMSKDAVRRVWCLIDGEQTAFSINASLEWDVEELKDAIQRRRTRLKTIDIIDLVLWKVILSYSGVNVVLTCGAHSWMIPFQYLTMTTTILFLNFFLNQSLVSLSSWTSARRSCRMPFHFFLRTISILLCNCLVSKYMFTCVWETDNHFFVPLLLLLLHAFRQLFYWQSRMPAFTNLWHFIGQLLLHSVTVVPSDDSSVVHIPR